MVRGLLAEASCQARAIGGGLKVLDKELLYRLSHVGDWHRAIAVV